MPSAHLISRDEHSTIIPIFESRALVRDDVKVQSIHFIIGIRLRVSRYEGGTSSLAVLPASRYTFSGDVVGRGSRPWYVATQLAQGCLGLLLVGGFAGPANSLLGKYVQ